MNNIKNYTHNISFKAKPVAEYTIQENTKKQSNKVKLNIYQLEPGDIPALEKINSKLENDQLYLGPEKGPNDIPNLKLDIAITIDSIIKSLLLKSKYKVQDSSEMYIATVNNQPCGLIVGNMPKINQNCQIVHSDRNKNDEIEMNCLVAWQTNINKTLKGVGTALVAEFFNFCSKCKDVSSIYLKSEPLDKSIALKFYEHMGFKQVGTEPIDYEVNSSPRQIAYLLDEKGFEEYRVPVYPMEMSNDDAKNAFNKFASKMCRQELKHKSINLEDELKL